MPVFEYRARDSVGNSDEGSLEAVSREVALAELHERDLHVSFLAPRAEPRRPHPAHPAAPGVQGAFTFVSLRDRSFLWRQAAQMQIAGMSISHTLTLLGDTGRGPLARFCQRQASAAGEGQPLSRLISEAPELFGPLEYGLIRAGEALGRLDVQMNRLAENFEKEISLRNKVRWRLMYVVLTALASVACSYVITVVVPAIGGAAVLPATLRFLVPYGIAAAALLALRVAFYSSPAARWAIDRFKLAVPFLGGVFRRLSIARFARSLSALVGAGLPVGEALEIAAPTTGNVFLAQRLLELPPLVRDGLPLASALVKSGQFPPQVVQMVFTGEEAGSIDTLLDKVAQYYEADAESSAMILAIAGCVALMLIQGIMVGIYVIRFWTNFYGAGSFNVPGLGDLLE
ncbi:MAG: type II secretion system F family protein [Armatimonadetes bacterium]|nr:type II secretion system F family protein [Armatimonadota bacterium]